MFETCEVNERTINGLRGEFVLKLYYKNKKEEENG